MKKISSFMLVCFFMFAMILFSGCVPTVDDVAGSYNLVEVYSEGKTYKVGEDLNGDTLTADAAVLTLNKDDTFSASYADLDFGENIEGSWDKIEKRIVFTSASLQTIELNFEIKKDGNLLLLIDNEAVLLLTKQVD